jgi:hypothetical protein
MATLAYAGRGTFVESSSRLFALRNSNTVAAEGQPVQPAVGDSSSLGARQGSREMRTAITPNADRIAGSGHALATSPDPGLLPGSSGSGVLSGERDGAGRLVSATGSPALLGSASVDRPLASRASKRTAKSAASRNALKGGAGSDGAKRAVTGPAGHAPAAREPSWSDVNEALAARDRTRASELLASLAERGRSPDTRAKAQLGIAQLEAGRGDCEKGQRLALEVAARPGIEIKTIRRALELAARCAK